MRRATAILSTAWPHKTTRAPRRRAPQPGVRREPRQRRRRGPYRRDGVRQDASPPAWTLDLRTAGARQFQARSRMFSSSRRVVVKGILRSSSQRAGYIPIGAALSAISPTCKREGVSRDGEKGVCSTPAPIAPTILAFWRGPGARTTDPSASSSAPRKPADDRTFRVFTRRPTPSRWSRSGDAADWCRRRSLEYRQSARIIARARLVDEAGRDS